QEIRTVFSNEDVRQRPSRSRPPKPVTQNSLPQSRGIGAASLRRKVRSLALKWTPVFTGASFSQPPALRGGLHEAFDGLVAIARGQTPDPIPNSAVKTLSADGTAS